MRNDRINDRRRVARDVLDDRVGRLLERLELVPQKMRVEEVGLPLPAAPITTMTMARF